MRLQFTIVLLLFSAIIYGQASTLYKNVNSRAKELENYLNKTGDSIIFQCTRTIFEVVVYNDDFERVVKVRNIEAKIPIGDLPVGKYIVETLLSDKLIVTTLMRNEPFNLPSAAPLITDLNPKKSTIQNETPKDPLLTKQASYGNEIKTKKTDLAVPGKKARPVRKIVKKPELPPRPQIKRVRAKKATAKYWVVYTINSGTSTLKSQKLTDQETVDQMIRKIEIDMKTATGRLNELSVWEVFDSSVFVRHKRNNKTNYMEVASDSFKMEPYFSLVQQPKK